MGIGQESEKAETQWLLSHNNGPLLDNATLNVRYLR
jgi:hypothetical protein